MGGHSRSAALTWGLILVAVGVILTVGNFQQDFSTWRFLARYWPVILIIIGVKKLYGHFTWQETTPAPTNLPKE